ncbi:MAG: DUF2157 domain-containing protein [Lentisphaeria bacterium]|nr:DUF2157 domain-containing protein [Lentisphaeria bacterium]
MSEKKHIRWLLDELPRLREREIIPAETETALRTHYSARLSEPGRNYFLLALGILGLALIAGGIILIFNYNWDMLSEAEQTAVSFLPLLLGLAVSFYTLLRGKSQLWREASAILTSAGGAVAVALLSQIYQLNGSLSDYMTLVLLTSLPLIFIFDSIGLAALYCFGMFALLFDFNTAEPNSVCRLIPAGILVWLVLHQRKGSPYRIAARYLMLPAMLFTAIRWAGFCPGLMLFTMAGFFLLLACELADEDGSFWKNPWFPVSFLLLTVMLTIGAESERLFRIYETVRRGGGWAEIAGFWIAEGIMLAGAVVLTVRNLTQKKKDVIRVMIPILLLLLLAGFAAEAAGAREVRLAVRVAINCYMGAFGIALLCEGARSGSLLVFNEGMLVCAALFALRFLSSDLGLVVRGIGMIAAGLIIIGANVYLSRKIRLGKEVVRHETK